MSEYYNNAMRNNRIIGEMKETMEADCTDNEINETDIATLHSTL